MNIANIIFDETDEADEVVDIYLRIVHINLNDEIEHLDNDFHDDELLVVISDEVEVELDEIECLLINVHEQIVLMNKKMVLDRQQQYKVVDDSELPQTYHELLNVILDDDEEDQVIIGKHTEDADDEIEVLIVIIHHVIDEMQLLAEVEDEVDEDEHILVDEIEHDEWL